MFIVPRTPISPRRLSPISMVTLSPQTSPSQACTSVSPIPQKDVYDNFAEIYFSVDIKVRNVLLGKVINFVGHPVYAHLLRTMDENNAHHVMGYLRSQRSVEMYIILDQISRDPLPTKEDFFHSINRF